jgi:hypothetical protein
MGCEMRRERELLRKFLNMEDERTPARDWVLLRDEVRAALDSEEEEDDLLDDDGFMICLRASEKRDAYRIARLEKLLAETKDAQLNEKARADALQDKMDFLRRYMDYLRPFYDFDEKGNEDSPWD